MGTTDLDVIGTKANALVNSVQQNIQISINAQNTDFSTIGADFLDFSEGNPFGDPENN